jgi:superfamily II DNA or RNA helicase
MKVRVNRREALNTAIEAAKADLADLGRRRDVLEKKIDALREALRAEDGEDLASLATAAPTARLDAREKVALFRSFFRGREDVFPKLWANSKTGKKGYAPACGNEWVRGVCEKPRVRCGECPSQAFVSVSDQVILDHLQGRHVIGCYPLLPDETCWFVAADFDKAEWRADVSAFVATSGELGVPVAVERSRSGNGAHAWFFFSSPVPASEARRMASFLLTETMSRRHELSMESYDRLFPNQDTMPRGGFGNLIALPLQHSPRAIGNTVFLDANLEPHPDQWEYLLGVKRMSRDDVETIASEAARKGLVVGVRMTEDGEDEGDAQPWHRTPARRSLSPLVRGPLPAVVHVVLAQRLFVEKEGLPSPLLNQIKRLAAFQNPEFFKKQGLRLPTSLTPRVISCAEDHPRHVSLPRGCLENLRALLARHAVKLDLLDERYEGASLDVSFASRLDPRQEEAGRELLTHDTGVFVAPPGTGKTVIGSYLIAARARATLVLVHRQPLLDQWVEQLSLHLGIDPQEIGRVGGGIRRPNGRLDVAMIQSLVRGETVDEIVGTYGHVIMDECHHIPAVSFERVLSGIRAKFVVGLTATAKRRDGHQPILYMQIGPVRFDLGRRAGESAETMEKRLVVRDTSFALPGNDRAPSIQGLYAALGRDEARNDAIVRDVTMALAEGRSPIVLTERRDHLDILADRLTSVCKHVAVLRGGTGAKERRRSLERLRGVPPDEPRLILATGRYVGEGFDDARLDTLFLAMPISWRGTLIQYAGRIHRPLAGKSEARIVDYVDRQVPALARMFERRMRGYREIGYRIADSQASEPIAACFDIERSGAGSVNGGH